MKAHLNSFDPCRCVVSGAALILRLYLYCLMRLKTMQAAKLWMHPFGQSLVTSGQGGLFSEVRSVIEFQIFLSEVL